MIYKSLRKNGDPILKKRAEPVTEDSAELLEVLYLHMKHFEGMGLAGPQIGISLRVAVVEIEGLRLDLINPVILEKSGTTWSKEACLSIPDVIVPVRRHNNIFIESMGERFNLYGLTSRVVQHEIDHLDGILITDRACDQLWEKVCPIR